MNDLRETACPGGGVSRFPAITGRGRSRPFHGGRTVLAGLACLAVTGPALSHGYIFTEPHAERIGINLYWMMAYCYSESNTEIRPFM